MEKYEREERSCSDSLVNWHESIHLFHVVLLNTEDHIVRVHVFII